MNTQSPWLTGEEHHQHTCHSSRASHLLCLSSPQGQLMATGHPRRTTEREEAARLNRNFPLFPILHADHSWIQSRCWPTCQQFPLCPGSYSNTELSMRVGIEALRKIKSGPCRKKKGERRQKRTKASSTWARPSHVAALTPPLDTVWCEDTGARGRKDRGK